jgi:rsbT antagonist protein RsbS
MSGTARIPIIKLYDNLIVSIQVALSDRLVMLLKDDITLHIEETGARGLVVDVSGIDVMDSYISRAIRDIGLIAQLMGVRTVISGMDPMIAMTLVEMGLDLKGVYSALNLEMALELLARMERDTRRKGGARKKVESDRR